MLYHLLYPLRHEISGLNLFGYITFRSAGATITALLISFLFGPAIIRTLKVRQIRETIRTDGPPGHFDKTGTPTMGGLIILLSVLVPVLLFARLDNIYVQVIIGTTLWMAGVGFLDDYLKVVKKYPKGLIGRYKLVGQFICGLIVGFIVITASEYRGIHTYTMVPFFKNIMINFSWFYVPLVMLIIAGTSNAVNLTDGLDGLAIGLVGISAVAFAGMSYITGRVDFSHYLQIPYLKGAGELTVYCSALIGASLGFLWFNFHPASIFMGDTGAIALGGALGVLSVLLKKELLLLIVGGVFWMENISVILQVLSFRWRGKRIFKMAPLHHHFELLGWPEEKIVVRLWIIGILLALLSLGTFKVR